MGNLAGASHDEPTAYHQREEQAYHQSNEPYDHEVVIDEEEPEKGRDDTPQDAEHAYPARQSTGCDDKEAKGENAKRDTDSTHGNCRIQHEANCSGAGEY